MRHVQSQIAESYMEHKNSFCKSTPVFTMDSMMPGIMTTTNAATSQSSMVQSSTAAAAAAFLNTPRFLVMKCDQCRLYNIIV